MRIPQNLSVLSLLAVALSMPGCGGGSFDLTDANSGGDADTDADADSDSDADSDADADANIITIADCTESCSDWCVVHPSTGSECVPDCHDERQTTTGLCCPVGTRAVGDTCPLPDLWVDRDNLYRDLEIVSEDFGVGSCAYQEGCINGDGVRRLLRFDTTTPNTGVGDFHVGRPSDAQDLFDLQTCHGHVHFDSYAWYELTGDNISGVSTGRKQAFCLMDFEPWETGGRGTYDCSYQGISAGWADTYDSYLPCQYIDITEVPSGDYTLSVHVNYQNIVAESDYDNNITEVSVTIP